MESIMTNPQPCDLGAVEARSAIALGTLTVRVLLESCITRIEAENPKVNAVVSTCFEDARARADELDALRPDLDSLPPLFGLPILVKDLIDTKGLKTTYGSLCFADHIPEKDSDIIRRLRDAGAIILGKTNTPEFGAGANTFNKVFGATRNPYDHALTCGGSSGGSAVAVAMGMAPLAIGSDFGGSLRIPASFCGVVGMRPTPGRVPCSALAIANSLLWTEGPMARNVEDAALCLRVIEGYEPGDPRSSHRQTMSQVEDLDLSQMTVGTSLDFGIATMDDSIRELASDRLERLAKCFSERRDIAMDFSAARDAFRTIRVMDVTATAHALSVETSAQLGENVQTNLKEAQEIPIAEAAEAAAGHSQLMRNFLKVFDDVDVILAPATGVSPFPVKDPFPISINGAPLANYTDWYALTWAISLTGCPVVSIPCGNDHLGLPFGIQVITKRHQDGLALAIAEKLTTQERFE